MIKQLCEQMSSMLTYSPLYLQKLNNEQPLPLALWNANGLTQHAKELRTFISDHNIDVMLISETHFADKNYFTLPFYSVYRPNHPAGTARG
jgi:hypothetical protein